MGLLQLGEPVAQGVSLFACLDCLACHPLNLSTEGVDLLLELLPVMDKAGNLLLAVLVLLPEVSNCLVVVLSDLVGRLLPNRYLALEVGEDLGPDRVAGRAEGVLCPHFLLLDLHSI